MPWMKYLTTKWMSRAVLTALALAVASFATYECVKPVAASAASAAPAAAPLPEDSVSALTAVDRAMETLAAHVTPAVVNVTVTSRVKVDQASAQLPPEMHQFFGPSDQFGQFFGPHMRQQQQIEHGIGSGVVISPDGYIVTNNHVVDGAVDIRVTTSDRRVLKAKLAGTDPLTDLAVIKVDASNLPSVPFSDSADVRPGQTVLAFGNPFGLRFTVTRGIVSAVNRPNPDASDPRKPGQYIQTDAAINQGNSGGPLVDARGEIVGINTFLISPSGSFAGMGFAIPTKIVKPTVEALIRDGKVAHSRIGVGITDVTPENAKFFADASMNGAVITQVEPDSPGGKVGLEIGDVISGLDGKKIADAGELQALVSEKHPGTKVTLEVLHEGKNISVPVTLEEMGSRTEHAGRSGEEGQGKARWGVGISDLTPEVRDQLQAPSDLRGAVIEQVQPGSPADNAGLERGDVILGVNRHPTKNAAEVQQALKSVPAGQDALVLVWSSGGNTFRVLHSGEGA
jgi:serine protease Do